MKINQQIHYAKGYKTALLLVVTLCITFQAKAFDTVEMPSTQAQGTIAPQVDTDYYLYSLTQGKYLHNGGQYGSGNLTDGPSITLRPVSAGSYYTFTSTVNAGYLKSGAAGNGKLWWDGAVDAATAHWYITPSERGCKLDVGATDGASIGSLERSEEQKLYLCYLNLKGQMDFTLDVDSADEFLFITPDAYQLMNVRVTLAQVINEAASIDVDNSEAIVLYNESDATLEEMEQTIQDLREAIALAMEDKVTPENPIDYTYLIPSSNFSTVVTGNGIGNWTKTVNVANAVAKTTESDSEVAEHGGQASGAMTLPFYENWSKSALYGEISTTLTGLPNGVYQIGLSVFVNANSYLGQHIFGNDVEMNPTSNFFTHYNLNAVVEEGTLKMGLRLDSLTNKANWVGLDNASLTYTGNVAASYQVLLDQIAGTIDEQYPETFDEFIFTLSYKENYRTLAETAVTNGAHGLATYKAAIAAQRALEENRLAWAQLSTYAQQLEEEVFSTNLADNDQLVGDLDDVLTMVNMMEATTEEVQEAYSRLVNSYQEAIHSMINPGDDCTALIHNPNFNPDYSLLPSDYISPNALNGFNAWKMEKNGKLVTNPSEWADGNWCQEKNSNGIAAIEYWNGGDFNLYQDLTGLQNGVYQLNVEAFYRTPNQYNAFVEAQGEDQSDNTVCAYLYCGTNQVKVPNIYLTDDTRETSSSGFEGNWYHLSDGTYVPHNRVAVASAFELTDKYLVTVNAIVTNGSIRIGLRETVGMGTGEWTIWSAFKMKYLGADLQTIKPVLEEELTKAQALAEKAMQASYKEQLSQAIASAQQVAQGTDGQAMLEAYQNLTSVELSVQPSVASYSTLHTLISQLMETISIGEALPADAQVIARAQELVEIMEQSYTQATATTNDLPTWEKQVNLLVKQLKIVAGVATDQNPIDYTLFIQNPLYEFGTSGWTVVKENSKGGADVQDNDGCCIAEMWNTAGSWTQTITDLPEGTYLVKVNAFTRVADKLLNANYFKEGTVDQHVHQYLYANGDSISPINLLSHQVPINNEYGEVSSGYWQVQYTQSYTDSLGQPADSICLTNFMVPDLRASTALEVYNYSKGEYRSNVYENEFYAYVDASGVLTLAAKNLRYELNNWMAFTNWRLFYVGTESSHEEATRLESTSTIEELLPISTHIYSIDGRSLSGYQKGLNLVRTLYSNGSVKVSKLFIP